MFEKNQNKKKTDRKNINSKYYIFITDYYKIYKLQI